MTNKDCTVTRGVRWLSGDEWVTLDVIVPNPGSRLPFVFEVEPGMSDLQIEFFVRHLDAAYTFGLHRGIDLARSRMWSVRLRRWVERITERFHD